MLEIKDLKLASNEASYIIRRQYERTMANIKRGSTKLELDFPISNTILPYYDPNSDTVVFQHMYGRTERCAFQSRATHKEIQEYINSFRSKKAQIADKIFQAARDLGVKIKRVPLIDYSTIHPTSIRYGTDSMIRYRNLSPTEFASLDISPEDMYKFLSALDRRVCPEGSYMLVPVVSEKDIKKLEQKTQKMAPSKRFQFDKTTEKSLINALIVHGGGKELIDDELGKEMLFPSFKIIKPV